MKVENSAPGKGTSGMDMFGSVIDRMNMKLGSKFLNSLSFENQLLKRLQRVIVVDGATHSNRMVWRVIMEVKKDGAEDFMLLLRGAQLVLWLSVLTVVFDLDVVNITLEHNQIFGSVLSGEGGSANGWRGC